VGFQPGDEFLLGPVSTSGAPALGDGLAQIASQVRGNISLDPALSSPMSWYTRARYGRKFTSDDRLHDAGSGE
jgi:hypothetical protein